MSKLVIADTSCLIVLEKINHLTLLREVFKEITVTQEISEEFGNLLPEWIDIKEVSDKIRQQILELDLDKGEASAIALGLEHKPSLLLMDEKKGRKIAQDLGLSVTGTLGVLIRAKEHGLVHSLVEVIQKLKEVEFRMSEKLIRQILEKYESL